MDSLFDRLPGQRTSRRWRIIALLAVVARRQTYLNLAYLVAAFPLGLFYFLVLIVGFSVGVGTAIIGVGIALLILFALASWGFATFERELVMWWLDVRIRPMSTPPPPHATAWPSSSSVSAAFSAIRSCGRA